MSGKSCHLPQTPAVMKYVEELSTAHPPQYACSVHITPAGRSFMPDFAVVKIASHVVLFITDSFLSQPPADLDKTLSGFSSRSILIKIDLHLAARPSSSATLLRMNGLCAPRSARKGKPNPRASSWPKNGQQWPIERHPFGQKPHSDKSFRSPG